MESKGHFCYGCNEYFHDSRFGITTHKGCKGKKSLGICVDSKEFGEYHPYNLENKSKWGVNPNYTNLNKINIKNYYFRVSY